MFVDTTEESGLLATRDGKGGRGWTIADVGDLDSDGDTDAILCPGAASADDECAAFLNDGAARFTFAPAERRSRRRARSSASAGALLDFDRDGVLDYWPGTFGERPLLFRGSGDGRFTDVGRGRGPPDAEAATARSTSPSGRNFGVTACDLDGDGDDDVLLADYGREANQVWRNDGGTSSRSAQALGVAFDDRMDFSDDESYRCFCQANPGKCKPGLPAPVTCSVPDRGWVPGQSDQPWRLGGNNFGIACGDLDDDGDIDLMTADHPPLGRGERVRPVGAPLNDAAPPMLAKFRRPGNDTTGLARPHTAGVERGRHDAGVRRPRPRRAQGHLPHHAATTPTR